MSERIYAPGDVIYQEGDPSHDVCLIRSGRVEIVKEVENWPIVLGTIGAGDYVGEMGIIEGKPRGATVRAETEVEVEFLGEEEFLRRISDDHTTALKVIQRLSARLRSANQLLEEIETASASISIEDESSAIVPVPEPEPEPGPDPEPARHLPALAKQLVLQPVSEAAAAALPPEGLLLENLPYFVGRAPAKGERKPSCVLGLSLQDKEPFRLSRVHFSIVRIRDGFMVNDASSTLGTLVNGEFIGQHASKAFVKLEPGENQILAGGLDSSFAFRAVVSDGS